MKFLNVLWSVIAASWFAVMIWAWQQPVRPNWVSSYRDGILAVLFVTILIELFARKARKQPNG